MHLRLRSLFKRSRVESELDDELQFHLEKQVEENIAAGMSARKPAIPLCGRSAIWRKGRTTAATRGDST